MIKLIASDIDGTLVNSEKELPPDFDEIIRKLSDKNIGFAVSSGRSLIALQDQFGKYMNDISIVCDNGAVIIDKGEILSQSVMPHDKIVRMIEICNENGMIPLLCSPTDTFMENGSAEYLQEVERYYKKRNILDNLKDYSGEITKVAVYCEKGIEDNGLELLKREFAGEFTVVLSGYYWADIMNTGVSKGNGIELLQRRLGASYESTMAFGDYLNDIEMLNSAYYSYAMENAHPAVKAAANFHAGSCEDFSVTKEIRKLIFPDE